MRFEHLEDGILVYLQIDEELLGDPIVEHEAGETQAEDFGESDEAESRSELGSLLALSAVDVVDQLVREMLLEA